MAAVAPLIDANFSPIVIWPRKMRFTAPKFAINWLVRGRFTARNSGIVLDNLGWGPGGLSDAKALHALILRGIDHQLAAELKKAQDDGNQMQFLYIPSKL